MTFYFLNLKSTKSIEKLIGSLFLTISLYIIIISLGEFIILPNTHFGLKHIPPIYNTIRAFYINFILGIFIPFLKIVLAKLGCEIIYLIIKK